MAQNPLKRQLMHSSSSDEPAAKRSAIVRPLKLIDLNEYVLEEIFSNLDVADLLNVVNSEKAYLPVCRRVFKRKYWHKCIKMELMRYDYQDKKENFSRIAEFFRYFGEVMSKVEFSVDVSNCIDQRIFHLIISCCRQTLTEIKVLCPTNKLKFHKSFSNVQKLIFSHGDVNMTPRQLVVWFPALKKLVFENIKNVEWLLKSGRKISSLKCLSIRHDGYFGNRYHIQDFHEFIAVNSQITDINLTLNDENIDISERRSQSISHKEIVPDEPLSVKLYITTKPYGNELHYLNSLEHLKIPNDKIEHLDVRMFNLTAQSCDYITRCVSLKTLTVATMLYHSNWNENNAFRRSSWRNLKMEFDRLTRLEILLRDMRPYRDVEDYFKYALDAIEPFLQRKVKTLATIVVRFEVSHQRPADEAFERIPRNNRFVVSMSKLGHYFSQKISAKEIAFILTKTTL